MAARTKPSGALGGEAEPEDRRVDGVLVDVGLSTEQSAAGDSALWFDEPLTGWIFLGYQVVAVVGWLVFVATGSVRATFALLSPR